MRMLRFSTVLNIVGLLPLLAVLGACHGDPTKFAVAVSTNSAVNPDNFGRPSPIVTQIYELSNSERFSKVDIIQLIDHDRELLGGDLLARNEVVVQPGETKTIDLPYLKDTKFIGFVSDFRDIDHADARAVAAAPSDDRVLTELIVDKLSVKIQQAKQR